MTTTTTTNKTTTDLLKRAFDIAASAAALAILTPPLAALSLWIRADSPGPVLFKQTRVGRDLRPFHVLKFRTMHYRPPDTIDQVAEKVVSTGHDPRITRAGRFLRKTSLDELPQLINILRGDMSIVGPRPILPDQLQVVPDDMMPRFDVRPGLTGLAQVRGRRSLGWLEQLAHDVEYVATRSLLRDFFIIARTFRVVLSTDDIYADESKNWRAYLGRVRDGRLEPETAAPTRTLH